MDFQADDEIVFEYLAECREHLATIEVDLLAIEQGGAAIDEQLVNRVFRAAHSIKGGAAFFDLNHIRELAHKTENVLDMIRSRQMAPTPEVVSVLLLAFDKLRNLIHDHTASNDTDISEFVEALVRLTVEHLPTLEKQSLTDQVPVSAPRSGRLIPVSAFDLKQAREGGMCLYLIGCDLIHDVQRRGRTPYEVIRSLARDGRILDVAFDLDSAGTLADEPSNSLLIEVLYATGAEPGQIARSLELPPERISLVARPDAAPPATSTSATGLPASEAASAPEPATTQVSVPPPSPAPGAPVAPKAVVPVSADATVRLNVTLLDSLMTLAGELVLSRNQLNESLARRDERATLASAQRVSLVTSELQEVVSLTRMQPVGTIFSKFPRLVRDLARELGKEVQLQVEGGEVELDKSILEGLSDPLTHMVRNSVDHGIEAADVRAARGKARAGTVTLKASHHAGQVVIEVSDDGKGLDSEKVAAASLARGMVTRDQLRSMSAREKMSLILLPGVSTAESVSDVSGRGVGMDVVKTNLDKLGGKMEIESAPGHGTSFRIKLPLTMAIIPSLLISDGGERFAIPQMNVRELVRIPAAEIANRIDRVGEAEVLILRDRLVPLVHLSDALDQPRNGGAGQAWHVVLVDTGAIEYGLVVEELHDTVEIVVKPLGRHLKRLPEYAGATVPGDGRVAVILDVAGLAARAGLSATRAQASTLREAAGADTEGERQSLLLFHNAPGEACAVPTGLVSRIERVAPSQIESLGGRRTMQYRNTCMPVIALDDVASVGHVEESQSWVVIVFERAGQLLGLLAAEPLDMFEASLMVDRRALRQRGIAGSAALRGRTTLIVDLHELVDAARPTDGETRQEAELPAAAPGAPTVLVADDSGFFRSQLQRVIEGVGCNVLTAEDGQIAWDLLDQNADKVELVATDIEMPNMDGLALVRRIRADARFSKLPVIAVSTLASEDEVARGLAAGVTEYQVKLDKDEFVKCIRRVVDGSAATACPGIERESER